MTGDEVVSLVADIQRQQCELEDVEVKSAAGGTPTRTLRESLSAFANKPGGGIILFGLDESQLFAVTGVGNLQKLLEDISSAASEIEPPVRIGMSAQEVDGSSVVAIEVPETPTDQKPSYIRAAGLPGGAFIRVGPSNRRMTDHEVFGFISNRGQPLFDAAPVVAATVEDFERGKIEQYFENLRQARPGNPIPSLPFEDALISSGIAVRVENVIRPTLAGLLIFGTFPQQFQPQLRIVFLHYFGITTTEPGPRGERFLDNQSFEGSVDAMVESAVVRVMSSLRKSSLIHGLFRTDIPEYPEIAIREAIANAVAHRDYSDYATGSHIQVRLFADRIEIESPGGLYGPVTVEDIEHAQTTRNRTLMTLLEYIQVGGNYFVENRGSGIDTMIAALRQSQLEPPQFRDKRSAFIVTFKSHTLLDAPTVAWLNQFARHKLNENQRLALAYLLHNDTITNSDFRRLANVDTPIATRELRGLVDEGLVEQIGTRRWATYALIEQYRPQLPSSPETLVLKFVREHGSINNSQVRELLGLSRQRATELLSRLKSEGFLISLGERKGTTYRIPTD